MLDIKKSNRNHILKFIVSHGVSSRKEIAEGLGISMPTVLHDVSELMEVGIIRECGQIESHKGRKASQICLVEDFKYTLGIDIASNHYIVTLLDLCGKVLSVEQINTDYSNDDQYFIDFKETILKFLCSKGVLEEQILGMGVSVPGFVDKDNNYITNIADNTVRRMNAVPFKVIDKMFPWNCSFINDTKAAAVAELCELSHRSTTIVYLAVNDDTGGAFCINGDIFTGNEESYGGMAHMCIVPNGKKCSCGQRGCFNAYCSMTVLMEAAPEKTVASFFAALQDGDEKCRKVWKEYLDYLALFIKNLRMCFNCNIIVGGYLGKWLIPYLEDLCIRVSRLNAFENVCDYIEICKILRYAPAIGAGRKAVMDYIARF